MPKGTNALHCAALARSLGLFRLLDHACRQRLEAIFHAFCFVEVLHLLPQGFHPLCDGAPATLPLECLEEVAEEVGGDPLVRAVQPVDAEDGAIHPRRLQKGRHEMAVLENPPDQFPVAQPLRPPGSC